MQSDEVKEFGLVIIESLKENDKQTGTILHDETIKYKKFIESNLSSYLYRIKTREELFQTLNEIIEKIKNDKLFPILHLEMHGFENGIQLASNEIVRWDELMEFFREINILLSNELVIMMSMCMGVSIISYIDPSKRAPFRAIIGTTREIDEIELLIGCVTFYDNYFFSFDPIKSLELMNTEIDTEKPTFHLLSSERCFEGMVDPDRDPVHFSKMIDNFSIIEKETNKEMKDKPMEEIHKYVNIKLRKMLTELKENKNYFLMTDLKKN